MPASGGRASSCGLEIARWLCNQGVRRLALVGRSGAARPEAEAAVAEMRAAGAHVDVLSLDVRDRAAVGALITRISEGPAAALGRDPRGHGA
jgi:phthiocerol/phenolphthiocerol synthesis type-I polyketide synthase C